MGEPHGQQAERRQNEDIDQLSRSVVGDYIQRALTETGHHFKYLGTVVKAIPNCTLAQLSQQKLLQEKIQKMMGRLAKLHSLPLNSQSKAAVITSAVASILPYGLYTIDPAQVPLGTVQSTYAYYSPVVTPLAPDKCSAAVLNDVLFIPEFANRNSSWPHAGYTSHNQLRWTGGSSHDSILPADTTSTSMAC